MLKGGEEHRAELTKPAASELRLYQAERAKYLAKHPRARTKRFFVGPAGAMTASGICRCQEAWGPGGVTITAHDFRRYANHYLARTRRPMRNPA